jgi:hypothetical protein
MGNKTLILLIKQKPKFRSKRGILRGKIIISRTTNPTSQTPKFLSQSQQPKHKPHTTISHQKSQQHINTNNHHTQPSSTPNRTSTPNNQHKPPQNHYHKLP